MSVKDFISDPASYSRSHMVTFGNISADAAGLRPRNEVRQQGWTSIMYEAQPAHFTNFAFYGDTKVPDRVNNIPGGHVRLGKAALHTVVAVPSHLDKGICYLPWRENGVSYIRIGGAAKTFFTGPLSGCSIYIGEGTDGSLWGFHANRNGIESGQRNTAVKAAMTSLTADGIGLGVTCRHSAIKGQHYDGFAFVFGMRNWRGRWSFHVADLVPGQTHCKVTALA